MRRCVYNLTARAGTLLRLQPQAEVGEYRIQRKQQDNTVMLDMLKQLADELGG